MLFEGGDHPGETMTIRVCEPPLRLHVTSQVGDEVWLLDVDLAHADVVTTLTLSTRRDGRAGLQRRAGLEVPPRPDGRRDPSDPSRRDFERDYYPAMAAYYTEQFR